MARPRKPEDERREHRRELWFTARELSAYFSNAAEAGLAPPDFARQRLCGSLATAKRFRSPSANVEETLALIQIGKDLRTIAEASARTGQLSNRLPVVLDALEAALEKALDQ